MHAASASHSCLFLEPSSQITMSPFKFILLLACTIAVLQLAVLEPLQTTICHWTGETFVKKTVASHEIAEEMCNGGTIPWAQHGCITYNTNCLPVPAIRGTCDTGLLGSCVAGRYICDNNQIVCSPFTEPEKCDGLDNDCDGTIDNGDSLCDDHDSCTTDTCSHSACLNTAVVCPGVDQCHAVATCDPLTGCPAPTVTLGVTCDDGDACTENDQCQSDGTCRGTAMICAAPADLCAGPGHCEAGTCVYSAPLIAGASCVDNDLCTLSSTCDGVGHCVGTSQKTCTASDQCHVAGTCNPSTGLCSNPAKTNGASCNDGNACTQTDTCQAGVCTSGNPLTCAASDQCHDAGTCNPSTGLCSNPSKTNGVACNDGNACTQSDTCQAGVCTGANPKTCSDFSPCQAGVCNPATGSCTSVNKPPNTSCDDGQCDTYNDLCVFGQCMGTSCFIPNGEPVCNTCAVGSCRPGYADCNSKSNDGCETPLMTSNENCGACGVDCGPQRCHNGQCEDWFASYPFIAGGSGIPDMYLRNSFSAVKNTFTPVGYYNSYFFVKASQSRSSGAATISVSAAFCFSKAGVIMDSYLDSITRNVENTFTEFAGDVWMANSLSSEDPTDWAVITPGAVFSYGASSATKYLFRVGSATSDPYSKIEIAPNAAYEATLSVVRGGTTRGHVTSQTMSVSMKSGTSRSETCGF